LLRYAQEKHAVALSDEGVDGGSEVGTGLHLVLSVVECVCLK
jgi:hypothetical protein